MIDINGIKYKTHLFIENKQNNYLICSTCLIKIKQYKYFNNRRIDLYEED